MSTKPTLVHLTTIDMSLELLLGPQLEAFAAAGYHVIGASAPGPYVGALTARGIDHHPLEHATRSWSPTSDLRLLRELHRYFRDVQPDIVHTHNPKPGVLGRLAARAARVPGVVNTVHGLYALPEDPLAKRAVVYGLERLAATCSDAELLQNEEDLPVLRRLGVPADRLHVLGSGLDLKRFRPDAEPPDDRATVRAELGLEPTDVVFGMVGRLVEEKGYPEVFAVAERLSASHAELSWLVVGPHDVDKPDALGVEAVRRAEANGVRFLGLRDDIERLYRAMDVFVLPSHREGFSRSGMEAAASGLPIITSDVRGCRQVVHDGQTGRLVAVRDVDALTAAVDELVHKPNVRSAMGERARRLAESEFDQQRQIDMTLGVYERLLA